MKTRWEILVADDELVVDRVVVRHDELDQRALVHGEVGI